MTFSYILLYYLASGEFDLIDYDDLPFEVSEEDSYSNISDKFDDYLEKHSIDTIEDELCNYSLGGGYEKRRVIFKFDDKIYGFFYTWSEYNGYEIDTDVSEFEPYEQTVTFYRLKKK